MVDYSETVEFSVVRAAATVGEAGISSTYSAWSMYSTVTIANPPAVSDYQVQIAVTYAAEMNADFSDLRFTDIADAALPYWIESSTASTSAVIWVKVAASTASILMFYGNAAATSESNGANVFDFYDDFSGATIDTSKWETSGSGTVSIANDVLTIQNGTSADQIVTAKTAFGTGYAVRSRLKTAHDALNGTYNVLSWRTHTGTAPRPECSTYFSGESSTRLYNYSTGWAGLSADAAAWAANTYGTVEIQRFAAAATWKIGSYSYSNSAQYPTNSLPVQFLVGQNPSISSSITVDFVTVRKCSATEPACTVGSPATNGTPATSYTTATVEYHDTIEFGRVVTPSIGPASFGCTVPFSVVRAPTVTGGTAYQETVEFSVVRVPDPIQAQIFITVPTSTAISTSIRRSITDAFTSCTETVDGIWEVPIDDFRGLQKVTPDQNGTNRCLFYGLVPDIDYALAYIDNKTNLTGYDYGWYLTQQFVPLANLTLPATTDPADYILILLGGSTWERVTGIRPYRIVSPPTWGTTVAAKEFRFTEQTTKADAIRQICEYYGMIWYTTWQNGSYSLTVDSPIPSRRLIRIEAEDYDAGGEGVGYHDVDTVNIGGAYRSGGPDIEYFASEAGYNVGWIRDGEWLKYTRSFPWAGQYALQFRVASMGTLTYFDVYLDGAVTPEFRIHVGRDYCTGSYSVFTNTDPVADNAYITVAAGAHSIKLVFGGNTEDVTPSNMHQNIGRIDCIPQSSGADVPAFYEPVGYFIYEDDLDSATAGLNLPPALTVTAPDSYLKNGVRVTRKAGERYNRIAVTGKTATDPPVSFTETVETVGVRDGADRPLEYRDPDTDSCQTTTAASARAAALLTFYQTDQRSYKATFMRRLDLQLYQLVYFVGYEEVTTAALRIVDIEYHIELGKNSVTVSLIPDQKFSNQRRLARMLFPTAAGNTAAVVQKAIGNQPVILVGEVTSVSGGSAVVTVESDGTTMNWRCT